MMETIRNNIERVFEGILWQSRVIVLFAVVASLFCSLTMFYMATVDSFYTVVHFVQYADPAIPETDRVELRSQTITHIVEIVDGYLLATVLLIFALGLYELFISRIDVAEKSETASNVLIIHSLDDLKARLAKVILMILIVRFFEFAIRMQFKNSLDLLYLAAGIALIGLALFLSHEGDKKGH